MAQQNINRSRRKLTREEIENNLKKAAANKAEKEKLHLAQIEKKSAIFKKAPGKILWWFSLLSVLLALIFITDNFLQKKYTSFDILSSKQDKVGLYIGGDAVYSTFYWAYLNSEETFGIHMHKNEFLALEKEGVINVGRSPIFNNPSNFKVKDEFGFIQTVNIGVNINTMLLLPLFILFFSIIWLFSKPQKSLQWIMFGYINMIVLPILILVLVLQILNLYNNVGLYEIIIGELTI